MSTYPVPLSGGLTPPLASLCPCRVRQVRTSGRLQRVDRARALAEKAAIMLRQWAGYLRSEKREKTKELYFWTDYVITHGTPPPAWTFNF